MRPREGRKIGRLIDADDNTLWIGMTNCSNGERFVQKEVGLVDDPTLIQVQSL